MRPKLYYTVMLLACAVVAARLCAADAASAPSAVSVQASGTASPAAASSSASGTNAAAAAASASASGSAKPGKDTGTGQKKELPIEEAPVRFNWLGYVVITLFVFGVMLLPEYNRWRKRKQMQGPGGPGGPGGPPGWR